MKPRVEKIVLVADLVGTAVFAVEGAISAMRSNLDLLGVMVIAFIVALGGGVTRDLLIGATPPNAVADWRYPAQAFLMGGVAFVLHEQVLSWSGSTLIVLDAAGLALFAVAMSPIPSSRMMEGLLNFIFRGTLWNKYSVWSW